jgi:glycosyltransferase involved in cell wall biosynthesis
MSARQLTFLTHNRDLGGGTKVIATLANLLAENEYDVEIVSVNPSESPVTDWFSDDVSVREFRHRHILLRFLELAQCLIRSRDRVIFSNCEFASILAPPLLKLIPGRHRLIIVAHTNLTRLLDSQRHKRRLQWGMKLARLSYGLADVIAAVSRGAADELKRYLRLERDVITLYNPVVDEIRVSASDPPLPELLKGLSRPWVVSAGRLDEHKDFEMLIDAFNGASPIGNLVILGEGEHRGQLEKRVATAGLAGRVFLPGRVKNPKDFMSHADLFVLSSRFEGLPTVLIEAMSTGCPVVATDCPSGPSEILEGGRYGRLVAVGDTESMAEAIAGTLVEPRDEEALKLRALDFSHGNALREYVEVIKTVSV